MTIGLVFPGQGTQKQEMGAPWRDTEAWGLVEEISRHAGEDVEELLLRTDADLLRRTDLAQLAVFAVSVMAHDEARRAGLVAEVAGYAGHSLGEYTALVAAGALGLADGARLVAARGRAMRAAAEAVDGTMGVLVAAPLEKVSELVESMRADGVEVWVANMNAPGQVVLSGSRDGIEQAGKRAPEIGAKLINLAVGGAFHSPYMAPAAEQLAAALAEARFAPEHPPVVANTDARAYRGDCDWPALAVGQLTSPVRWEESVRTLTEELGCTRLIELGPGKTLNGLIRRISPGTALAAVDGPDALRKLVEAAQEQPA